MAVSNESAFGIHGAVDIQYTDHCRLYRQCQIFARSGIELQWGALGDWIGKASFHLMPVVDRLAEELKRSTKLIMDETTAPVLDLGRGRAKSGFFWALARDDRRWGGAGRVRPV